MKNNHRIKRGQEFLDEYIASNQPQKEDEEIAVTKTRIKCINTSENEKSTQTCIDPSNTYEAAQQWLAEEFTVVGSRILHYWQGNFWLFEISRYFILSDEDIRAKAYQYLANCIDPKGVSLNVKKSLVDNFLDGLRAASKLSDTNAQPAFLENDLRNPSDYIACKNGLLRTTTRELTPVTPIFFNGNALDFDYNPQAKSPEALLAFLESIWGDDTESKTTLQEFFGYFLTLDTNQQKILLLVGPPRSGKGTIGRILTRLVGATNTCSPTLTALAAPFGLQTLIGKQLGIISDARVSGRVDMAAITENLLRISGEDFVSVPRKFRDDYTSRLPIRFILLGNELPSLADSSGALTSRFIILQMTQSFYGREDHSLETRLDSDLPAILNWALVGLDRLLKRGHFIQPASSTHLVDQLDSLGSPMKEFLDDCCNIAIGAQIECSRLFKIWQERCLDQNRGNAGTIQTFGKQLIAAAPSVRTVQRRTDGNRIRYYDGVKLKISY